MRPMLVAAALMIAPPASAADFTCSFSQTCSTAGGCSENDDPPIMTLSVAADGNSASLSFDGAALDMVLVDEGPAGQSFLALRPGEGVGILTLGPDGTLAASSNEFSGGALTGATALGTCAARNG